MNRLACSLLALITALTASSAAANATLHIDRAIDTLGSSAEYDTLAVTLSVFAEGQYDTLWDTVASFDTIAEPIDAVIYIDNTQSMGWDGGDRIAAAKSSASAFVEKFTVPDRAALVITGLPDSLLSEPCDQLGLEDHTHLAVMSTLTEEYETVINQIQSLPLGTFCNRSVWRDAVIGAGRYAIEHTAPDRQPTVVLLSDGADRGSTHSAEEVEAWVREKAETDSLRVFTIALGDLSEAAPMQQVAEASIGGRFYGSESSTGLAAIYDSIRGEITNTRIDTVYEFKQIPVDPKVTRRPVDAALYIDNTRSMDINYRIVNARVAAKSFIDNLQDQDRVAVLITGLPDSLASLPCDQAASKLSDHSHMEPLIDYSKDYDSAKSLIDSLALGTWCNRSVWRDAIIGAGQYAIENTDPGRQPTVIVLSDGADRGSVHSVTETILWARDRGESDNLRIFTIAFGDLSDAKHMAAVALSSANGKHFSASSGSELLSVYDEISQEIITNVGARDMTIEETLFGGEYLIEESLAALVDTTDSNSIEARQLTVTATSDGARILSAEIPVLPVWGEAMIQYRVAIPRDESVDLDAESQYRTIIAYERDDFTEEKTVLGKPEDPTRLSKGVGRGDRAQRRIIPAPGFMSVRTHARAALELYTANGRLLTREIIKPGGQTHIALPPARGCVYYRLVGPGGAIIEAGRTLSGR